MIYVVYLLASMVCNLLLFYALENDLIFNSQKSFGAAFLPRKFQLSGVPTLTLNHNQIRFVDSVKYLGINLRSTLNDDDDIARQVRYVYWCANMLKYRFFRCSWVVKNHFFRSYCTSFYSSQLWCKYFKSAMYRLRVAYDNNYRIFHNLLQWTGARLSQIECHINTFDSILCKSTFSFIQRCQSSSYNLINSLMTSGCFYESMIYASYNNLLFAFT